jgi:hypothetical protein
MDQHVLFLEESDGSTSGAPLGRGNVGTLVCTILVLSCLNCSTMSATSMVMRDRHICQRSIERRMMSVAMYVPVRPTPALWTVSNNDRSSRTHVDRVSRRRLPAVNDDGRLVRTGRSRRWTRRLTTIPIDRVDQIDQLVWLDNAEVRPAEIVEVINMLLAHALKIRVASCTFDTSMLFDSRF